MTKDWAADRRERQARARTLNEQTREQVAQLGITLEHRYDIVSQYEGRDRFHRPTGLKRRTDRNVRWSGRVAFGVAEFYAPRTIAGLLTEVSRFIDPAEVVEVRVSETTGV